MLGVLLKQSSRVDFESGACCILSVTHFTRGVFARLLHVVVTTSCTDAFGHPFHAAMYMHTVPELLGAVWKVLGQDAQGNLVLGFASSVVAPVASVVGILA